VVYGVGQNSFELVVSDAGVGVLDSLRSNSEYSNLSDSGTALKLALSDGASRHGSMSGRGYGISQLFRALAHDAGELRFRSGDYALRLWGDAPSLTGRFELSQKSTLLGMTVSIRTPPNSDGACRRG
jgi:hypothetical protein